MIEQTLFEPAIDRMSAEIVEPLQTVRTTMRRTAIVRGAALVVAVLIALLVGVGTLDWAIHFNQGPARLCFGVTIAIAIVAAIVWWIVLPAITQLSDFQIAKRIEGAYPEFAGRISNSVEFIENASDGSVELQERAINRASGHMRDLEPDQVVDRNPLRMAVSLALFAIAIIITLFSIRPVEAKIAVSRLVYPYRSIPWPRTTDLRILDESGVTLPDEVAITVVRGDFRELLVENTRGQLPLDASIEYRLGTRGKSRFETLQPVSLDVEVQGEVGRVVLSPTKSPIYVRAIGGDHASPWYRMDVVAPPAITELKITLTSPEYLNAEPTTLIDAPTSLDALVGSTVRVEATASKPIQSASVSLQDRVVQADVTDDGYRLQCEFTLRKEGVFNWWFELTDIAGVTDPRPTRYELRVVRDTPPDVFVEQPSSDIQVTATAQVPVRAIATDDNRVESLVLETRRLGTDDNQNAEPIILAELPVGSSQAEPNSSVDRPTEESQVESVWNLSQYDTRPGDRFVLSATASDAFDVDGQTHVVISDERTVVVVTADEKARELARLQTEILGELNRAVESQTRSRDTIAELRIQQREANVLRRADLDSLKRTEIDQHRIASSLFDNADGLRERVQALADEMDANNIDATESRSQLTAVLGELDHVRDSVVTPLKVHLSNVRKDVEEAIAESDTETAEVPEAATTLADIEGLQTEIVDSLSSVLTQTKAWQKQVNLQSSLGEVASRQDELTRETTKLADLNLNATADADRKQLAADSARIARRQERLGGELSDLLDDLKNAAGELDASDPALTERLRRANELAEQRSPSMKMQEAATELSAGRVTAASRLQADAAKAVRDLNETLAEPVDRPQENVLRDLTGIEQELRTLADEQRRLAERMRAADNAELPTLAESQSAMRARTDRQRRSLARSSARRASAAAEGAVEAMQAAEQSLSANEPEGAAERAEEAATALDRAAQETQLRRAQVQRQAAMQALDDAVTRSHDLIKAQQRILERTEEFEKQLTETGRRTRRQSRAVLLLGNEQGELATQVEALRDQLVETTLLPLLLDSASERMRAAEQLLSQRLTGSDTITAQRASLRDLLALVDSLDQPRAEKTGEANQRNDEQVEQDAGDESGELVPPLVRLKLIRALQQGIAERTQQLVDSESSDAEREQLARRQDAVAKLAAELLQELRKATGQ